MIVEGVVVLAVRLLAEGVDAAGVPGAVKLDEGGAASRES